MLDIQEDYEEIVKIIKEEGKIPEEYQYLYNLPHRDKFPWHLVYSCFNPVMETEGCHEG